MLVSVIGQVLIPITIAVAQQTIVTANQVNGTWRNRNGEFKIWALGKQRLRIEFSGVYEYSSPYGPMANTGEGAGTAFIEGDIAVFKPNGVDDDCKIVLRFKKNILIVEQNGICGFGHNVSAAGRYPKVSGKKPKFNPN
ncbi:MAG TPA: hypothetical protein PKY50_01110 [Candidatus Competibacter sp.]|nr:hypothetical protein [Candidatus Competibacter sp.]